MPLVTRGSGPCPLGPACMRRMRLRDPAPSLRMKLARLSCVLTVARRLAGITAWLCFVGQGP
eukprot:scaffold3713_cov372-Prasinococcus_capsulatus_cf.AAC.20